MWFLLASGWILLHLLALFSDLCSSRMATAATSHIRSGSSPRKRDILFPAALTLAIIICLSGATGLLSLPAHQWLRPGNCPYWVIQPWVLCSIPVERGWDPPKGGILAPRLSVFTRNQPEVVRGSKTYTCVPQLWTIVEKILLLKRVVH